MEKKENKADLEQLLNSLIEKGWKPFDVKGISEYFFESVPVGLYRLCWKKPDYDYNVYSKRELVSKESGLWQFVCEMSVYNNYNKEKGKVLTWKKFEDDKYQINGYSNGGGYIQDYEYRLIESALKDESELEEFLLSNIKVDE